MRVGGWKRGLDFMWHKRLPFWRLVLERERALFVIEDGGTSQTLIEVRRISDFGGPGATSFQPMS